MRLKQYRSQLAETTDDLLRYEFLRLIAQEGRLHFMSQIAEDNIGGPSTSTIVRLPSQHGRS